MLSNHDNPPTSEDARAAPESTAGKRVVVAVLTFQRPDTLAILLAAFAEMERPADVALTLLIIDNDGAASARETVAAWQPRIPGLA